MTRRPSPAHLLLTLLVLLAALVPAAGAQDDAPPVKPPEHVSSEEKSMLWSRGRDVLNPDVDRLQIRGIGVEDNDFRAMTPILKQTDRDVTYVDTEELRRRKLAMYESRASFTAPLPFSATPDFGHGSSGTRGSSSGGDPPADGQEPAPEDDDGMPMGLACVLTLMCIVGALFARRWLLE